jgi:hypothetical protein
MAKGQLPNGKKVSLYRFRMIGKIRLRWGVGILKSALSEAKWPLPRPYGDRSISLKCTHVDQIF